MNPLLSIILFLSIFTLHAMSVQENEEDKEEACAAIEESELTIEDAQTRSLLSELLTDKDDNLAVRLEIVENLNTTQKSVEHAVVNSLIEYSNTFKQNTPIMAALIEKISYSANLQYYGPKILEKIVTELTAVDVSEQQTIRSLLDLVSTCINNGVPIQCEHAIQQNLIDTIITAQKRIEDEITVYKTTTQHIVSRGSFRNLTELQAQNLHNFMEISRNNTGKKSISNIFNVIIHTIHTCLVAQQEKRSIVERSVNEHLSPLALTQLIVNNYLNFYDREPEITLLAAYMKNQQPDNILTSHNKCLIS